MQYDVGPRHLLSADDAQFLAAEWEACEKEGMEVPEVTIRSPLTCQEFGGICAKCYGASRRQLRGLH